MKVVQHIETYFPDSSGGMEVYVKGLTQDLRKFGFKSIVAAPHKKLDEHTYIYEDTEIYRYPYITGSGISKRLIPHEGFEYFETWLRQQKPDIYHLHSWIPSCGLDHLRLAQSLGLKSIVTIHCPDPICMRYTLMLNGKEPCDGQIDVARCSTCCGASTRLPSSVKQALGAIPFPVSKRLEKLLPPSRLSNNLVKPAKATEYHRSLLEMADLADSIVVVCRWLYDVLVANSVPEEKLILCRYGVVDWHRQLKTMPTIASNSNAPLKIGFLGRWSSTKGIDILVKAVRRLPTDWPIQLIIHGIGSSVEEHNYRARIEKLIASDRRIQIAESLSRDKVSAAIAGFDLLAVPSQWLETGPLVVLEAFAVGTPVIGSALGGIAELVRHQVDGWLVPTPDIANVDAWADAIAYLVKNREVLDSFRQNIQPVRTMQDVAHDIAHLYRQISPKQVIHTIG